MKNKRAHVCLDYYDSSESRYRPSSKAVAAARIFIDEKWYYDLYVYPTIEGQSLNGGLSIECDDFDYIIDADGVGHYVE